MSNPHVRQLLDLIKEQNVGLAQVISERDKLRAELDAFIAWANDDQDALGVLQRLYSDPSTSEGSRIKAASAALAFERPKLSVAVKVPSRPLFDILEEARLKGRVIKQQPPVIEHQGDPDPAA
jgi:hypothetical protein